MEIKIVKENKGDLLRANRTKWKLTYKTTYFYIATYALVGALIVIFNAATAKNAGDFWGLGTSLGIGLLFLALVYFSHTEIAKRKYIENTTLVIRRRQQDEQNTEIVIKDDGVTYRDFQSCSEWKWSVFQRYMLYKDYLFLMMGNSVLNSLVIQKTDLSVYEFDELINFCKGNLYIKK